MPPPLAVDWEAVKTLALAVGLAEASRQTGISYEAIRQRSSREGWIRSLPRDQELPPSIRPTPVTDVTSAPSAMANYLRDLSAQTRLKHAQAAAKVADVVADMDGQELLVTANQLLTAGKHAALVHGWAGSTGNVSIRLDVLAQANPDPEKIIDVQCTDIDE